MRNPDLLGHFTMRADMSEARKALPEIGDLVLDGPVKVWKIGDGARTEPDHQGGLATWLVNGPFHPFWKWWMIGLVHLRDIPGVRPAYKEYQEAMHEIQIVSLNPERGDPDIDLIESGQDWGNAKFPKFLTPADLVYQFHGVSDREATQIAESVVRAIVAGEMSPDSDFQGRWKELLDGTVAHYRAPGSPHRLN